MMQESKISCFHYGIGVCEELNWYTYSTSYTRLTPWFLVLWHLSLPIILWDDCIWIVVTATFIGASSLFCIEEVYFSSPLYVLYVVYIGGEQGVQIFPVCLQLTFEMSNMAYK